MKKMILAALFTIGFSATASAHHMAAYDDAGIYIPDSSPHLLMEF
jgi:hypothetical protein